MKRDLTPSRGRGFLRPSLYGLLDVVSPTNARQVRRNALIASIAIGPPANAVRSTMGSIASDARVAKARATQTRIPRAIQLSSTKSFQACATKALNRPTGLVTRATVPTSATRRARRKRAHTDMRSSATAKTRAVRPRMAQSPLARTTRSPPPPKRSRRRTAARRRRT